MIRIVDVNVDKILKMANTIRDFENEVVDSNVIGDSTLRKIDPDYNKVDSNMVLCNNVIMDNNDKEDSDVGMVLVIYLEKDKNEDLHKDMDRKLRGKSYNLLVNIRSGKIY